MWIAVRNLPIVDKSATSLQKVDDDWIRFEDSLSFVFWQSLSELPAIVDWSISLQGVFLSYFKVVRTVPWSCVDDAASLIQGNVFT